MHRSPDSPRFAWAIFLGPASLAAAFAAALFFQGVEYRALVAGFALALAAVALTRSRPTPVTTDLWVLLLGALLVAATLQSRVFSLSLSALLWTSWFFCAYVVARSCDSRFLPAAIGGVAALACVITLWRHAALGADLGGPFLYRHMFSAVVLVGVMLLAETAPATARWRPAAFGAAALLAFLLIGLSGSRGVMIAGAIGLGFVAFASPRERRADWVWFAAGALLGLLVANVAAHGLVTGRLATLADPAQAGSSRIRMWVSVGALLADRPWFGHGPGILFAVWPPFRDPTDGSDGFYAHNGYLDLALTAGIPAAAVAALSLRSALNAGWSGVRRGAASPWTLGALAVIAAHAMVDFNLMVPAIWLLAGLCAGSLAAQAPAVTGALAAGALRVGTVSAVVCATGLAAYAATSAVGFAAHARAERSWLHGDPVAALASVNRAIRWWPLSDNGYLLRATIVLSAALQGPTAAKNPAAIPALAGARLDVASAHARNPLRPATYRVAAGLDLAAARLGVDGDGAAAAVSHLRAGLALNPRDQQTRMQLADALWLDGRRHEALWTLVDGLDYPHARNEAFLERVRATRRGILEGGAQGGHR